MIELLAKMIIWGTLAHMIMSVIKHVNLMNIYILKIVLCKKRLIGKLVLECENKILNKTET